MIIFGSVWFYKKKVTKPNFFYKKTRNQFKPISFGLVLFGKKPVQTGLA
jgi:hypothetical protein